MKPGIRYTITEVMLCFIAFAALSTAFNVHAYVSAVFAFVAAIYFFVLAVETYNHYKKNG